jgi:fucose permease
LLTSEIADVFGSRAAMLLGALAFAVGAALLLRAKV